VPAAIARVPGGQNHTEDGTEMTMLAWNTLRVDPGDGSPVQDYRIENGHVEMRGVKMKFNMEDQGRWQRLTAQQLSSHVMGNTVVAQWLQRRMGVHSLIRACAQPTHSVQLEEESSPESLAA
jgi:hypothetical protein